MKLMFFPERSAASKRARSSWFPSFRTHSVSISGVTSVDLPSSYSIGSFACTPGGLGVFVVNASRMDDSSDLPDSSVSSVSSEVLGVVESARVFVNRTTFSFPSKFTLRGRSARGSPERPILLAPFRTGPLRTGFVDLLGDSGPGWEGFTVSEMLRSRTTGLRDRTFNLRRACSPAKLASMVCRHHIFNVFVSRRTGCTKNESEHEQIK